MYRHPQFIPKGPDDDINNPKNAPGTEKSGQANIVRGADIPASMLSGSWSPENMSRNSAPIYIIPKRNNEEDEFVIQYPGWMGLNCGCLGGRSQLMFQRVPGTQKFQCRLKTTEKRTLTVVKLSHDNPFDEEMNQINIDGVLFKRGLQSSA